MTSLAKKLEYNVAIKHLETHPSMKDYAQHFHASKKAKIASDILERNPNMTHPGVTTKDLHRAAAKMHDDAGLEFETVLELHQDLHPQVKSHLQKLVQYHDHMMRHHLKAAGDKHIA